MPQQMIRLNIAGHFHIVHKRELSFLSVSTTVYMETQIGHCILPILFWAAHLVPLTYIDLTYYKDL